MGNSTKNESFDKKVQFRTEQDEYVLQLKKKRSWWWLLWFLLLPLLFIQCEHDLKVTVLDERTKAPQENVEVEIEYVSHFFYLDSAFLVNDYQSRKQLTDKDGNAVFKSIRTSLFSYIFYCMSEVVATADEVVAANKLLHFTRNITLYLEDVDCDIDIVMCIDNTSSMNGVADMVKKNAVGFCDDLTCYCATHHRNIISSRIRVISFGDLQEKAIEVSPLFDISSQKAQFHNFVSGIVPDGGGDGPENSLEALALAMQTEWRSSSKRLRHIIVLYTDAPAHDLSDHVGQPKFYPANMPKSLKGLKSLWNDMNKDARKMVLFAPDCFPWEDIDDWDDVSRPADDLSSILSGTGYERVFEVICKSL